MTTADAIELYRTQVALAAALGISQSTVAEWGLYPPPLRQLQIERVTRGRLKAETDIFKRKRRAA